MLRVSKKILGSVYSAQLTELRRDVVAHARRKIVLKVSHDQGAISARLNQAFEQAHAFLSAREVDHYDSYVYLTISFFLLSAGPLKPPVQNWLANELISPVTRARTLYVLVRRVLKEGI